MNKRLVLVCGSLSIVSAMASLVISCTSTQAGNKVFNSDDFVTFKTSTQKRLDRQDAQIKALQDSLKKTQDELTMTRQRGNGVVLALGPLTKRLDALEKCCTCKTPAK